MKNTLLITTAMVSLALALPAKAEQGASGLLQSDEILSGLYENFVNSDNTRAGVATIDYSVSGVTVADGTAFNNNTTKASAGGALKVMNGIAIGNDVSFAENKADEKGWGGGALYIKLANKETPSENQEVTTGKVTFKGNSAGLGGAIALEQGILTIGEGSLFEDNIGLSGGAIAVWKDVADHGEDLPSTLKTAQTTFRGNKANLGGAIYNAGEIEIGENSIFEQNSAHAGGAIYALSGSETVLKDGVSFNGNKAEPQVENGAGDGAGAIYLTDSSLVAGNNISFTNNEAITEIDENTGAKGVAGAVYAYRSDMKFGNGLNVESNTSRYAAGGLYNWEGSVEIADNATFKNNESLESYAGAIGNFDGDMSIGENAQFDGNKAATQGGAVANKIFSTEESKLNLGANAVFKNNTANEGGAIYNQQGGVVTFNGNATFENNQNADGLNDIHNDGAINVASGTLTLDGGISGNGTTEFAEGTKLVVKNDVTTISNTVVNKGAELTLVLENGYAGGNYDLIVDDGSLDKEFDIAENGLYNIDSTSNGSYAISKKSSDELAQSTGANKNQTSAAVAIMNGTHNEATLDALSDLLSNSIQLGNDDDIKTAMDAVTAVSPEVAPLVTKTQTETTNQIFGAVSTRLSGGSVASGAEGISSGDSIFHRVAVWVQGLFNNSRLDDTSKAHGFKAKTNGVAFGIEKYLDGDIKAGIGYAYNSTDIDGFLRDTDVDSHTAIAYGEYKPNQWFVNGIATYSWADYSEKKNVLGNRVKADYDVESFGLQLMTGYETMVKNYDITPELGLRYMHIKQDGYKDSVGQRVSSDNSDVLTGVIGVKAGKMFHFDNGMSLKPQVRVAATYDLVNDNNNSVVTLANGSAYAVNGKALKRFGVEVGAGINADLTDSIELSVGYEGKFRQDYQDHTGLINAKYKF